MMKIFAKIVNKACKMLKKWTISSANENIKPQKIICQKKQWEL
jgi:hypothetical protein